MNEEKMRCEKFGGRLRIGGELWAALAGAVVVGLIGWGSLNTKVDAHSQILERHTHQLSDENDKIDDVRARLDGKIEDIRVSLSAIQASVAYLAQQEQRRQALEDRRK